MKHALFAKTTELQREEYLSDSDRILDLFSLPALDSDDVGSIQEDLQSHQEEEQLR